MRNTEQTSKKKIKKRKIGSGTATVFMVVFFGLYLALNVYESSCLMKLDTEIRALETRYEQCVRYNDDLQGRLLVSGSLNEIEAYAVNELGMVKPQSNSVSYVVYNRTDAGSIDSAQGDFSLKDWIQGLF